MLFLQALRALATLVVENKSIQNYVMEHALANDLFPPLFSAQSLKVRSATAAIIVNSCDKNPPVLAQVQAKDLIPRIIEVAQLIEARNAQLGALPPSTVPPSAAPRLPGSTLLPDAVSTAVAAALQSQRLSQTQQQQPLIQRTVPSLSFAVPGVPSALSAKSAS